MKAVIAALWLFIVAPLHSFRLGIADGERTIPHCIANGRCPALSAGNFQAVDDRQIYDYGSSSACRNINPDSYLKC
jgi:hypothetical protein